MFDRILALLDVILLLWIVQQGERLIKLERDTNLMARERYEERAAWRKAKQEQQRKKNEQKTSESNATSADSLSPTEPTSSTNKVTNAPSAAVPVIRPSSIISISRWSRIGFWILLQCTWTVGRLRSWMNADR
jgi:sRNA-binding protein